MLKHIGTHYGGDHEDKSRGGEIDAWYLYLYDTTEQSFQWPQSLEARSIRITITTTTTPTTFPISTSTTTITTAKE